MATGVHFDAVVLGAGISGLVAASILAEGSRRVLVIDEYPHIGGNHIDVGANGYTFDVGSLIFQDDSPLLAHFPELLSRYVVIQPTWSRLNPQGIVTSYPVSVRDDVLRAGPIEIIRFALSVAYARSSRRRPGNALDFARYWLGARFLRRSGLETYMERFYGGPPDEIDLGFAEKRMLWIKEHASLRRLLQVWRRPSGPAPQNRQLARPPEGFGHLYEMARHNLEGRGVTFRLAFSTTAITRHGDSFRLAGSHGEVRTDRIVSTIPINRALAMAGLPAEALRTVTLLSLFFSFEGSRNFSSSVLYNFSFDGNWKRLTVYSDFYGAAAGREFFTVEINVEHDGVPVGEAEERFRHHMAINGLFVGDLTLEGSHVLREAYPVYTNGAADRAAAAVARLRSFGIESLGRQGGFNYQPTARVSTVDAEKALGVRDVRDLAGQAPTDAACQADLPAPGTGLVRKSPDL